MVQLTQVLVVELKAFPLEHSQLLLASVIPEEQLSQIFSAMQVAQLEITQRTQDPALYDVKAGHPQDPLERTRFEWQVWHVLEEEQERQFIILHSTQVLLFNKKLGAQAEQMPLDEHYLQ